MKYQPVIPTDLFNMFIEKLGYIPEGKDILVIRDIYTACFLAINNDVTFVSDDQEAISAFINTVIINDDFKGENNYIHIDTKINNAWLNWIEEKMKFDVAIMNPPYNGNLHLKILEKVIPIANNVVNISPSNCYSCNRLKFSTDIPMYDTFKESVFKHCTAVDIMKGDVASKIFNIAQGTDLGISVYSKDYTDINYVSDKFVIYNNKELEKSLCKKFLKKCELSHWKTFLGEGDFVLNTSHVHGHVGNKDFTNLLCMRYTDALKVKKTADVRSCQFRFRTENERKNFFEAYMNSKCIHWWNLQWKNQIILVLKYIPYMSDYTQPWTDKRFCEYFGITGYIDDEHAETGSEWEIILKTME
ncbi:MAG: hypothetical protein IJ672_05855 [Methanobrevibacter sp.]|nr:hypothetical protein [Methanobrevibacter sp.]